MKSLQKQRLMTHNDEFKPKWLCSDFHLFSVIFTSTYLREIAVNSYSMQVWEIIYVLISSK